MQEARSPCLQLPWRALNNWSRNICTDHSSGRELAPPTTPSPPPVTATLTSTATPMRDGTVSNTGSRHSIAGDTGYRRNDHWHVRGRGERGVVRRIFERMVSRSGWWSERLGQSGIYRRCRASIRLYVTWELYVRTRFLTLNRARFPVKSARMMKWCPTSLTPCTVASIRGE